MLAGPDGLMRLALIASRASWRRERVFRAQSISICRCLLDNILSRTSASASKPSAASASKHSSSSWGRSFRSYTYSRHSKAISTLTSPWVRNPSAVYLLILKVEQDLVGIHALVSAVMLPLLQKYEYTLHMTHLGLDDFLDDVIQKNGSI